MTYPDTLARQLDRCQRCGRKTHRKDLVRTQVEYANIVGSNYLKYSSYSSAYWSTPLTPTSRGTISIGPSGDYARCKISNSNTITEINGSQTWSQSSIDVNGRYTGGLLTKEGTDVSSWTSLVFSAEVGPYHANTEQANLRVHIGIKDDPYDAATEQYTIWTPLNNQTRVWHVANVSDILADTTDLYFQVSVAGPSGLYWFVDNMSVEKNVLRPTQFIKTSGAVYDSTSTRKKMAFEAVCKDCYMEVLEDDDPVIVPGIEPPIQTIVQEL